MLVGDHREDELLEVPAMVLVVAMRDGDGPETVVLVWLVLAMNAETRGICMEELCAECQVLHDFEDDLVEEVRGPVLVDTVECAEDRVIREMVYCDSGTE